MNELGIIHGCCKADEDDSKNKSSDQVKEEGRTAARYLGVTDPLLAYYTCLLNRLGPPIGHKLPLPTDCPREIDAHEAVEGTIAAHDDSEYEEWVLDLERQSSEAPVAEGWFPLRLWRDVHVYLDHKDTRPPVITEVTSQLPDGSYVLLAHSLGSVISVDMIREERTKPSALVTVGSPLGLPGITRWIPPIQIAIPWVNIVDERDWVTLRRKYTPQQNDFNGNPYDDVWVDNPELDGDHDLIGYLSQREAIEAILPLLRDAHVQ
jgi:hypothetical protein